MCGRFVTRIDASIERYWSLVRPWSQPFTSNNVAPGSQVPAVLLRDRQRIGVFLRWGLIPFWAAGKPMRYSTINARAETLDTAASYRGPWSRGQRCIVPVLGFYEWQEGPGGKQPYFIRLISTESFGLAGLWDRSTATEGAAVDSCTIITLPANPLIAQIHAKRRMPAIITADTAPLWLEGSCEEARAALQSYPADEMEAYPVSRRVNSPRNDTADLLESTAGRESLR